MNFRTFIIFSAVCALLTAACVGCGTIYRAREAQRAVRGVASAEPTNIVATGQYAPLPKFGPGDGPAEFIRYALTNRPSIVSARLAVASAALALQKTHSDRYPQLGVSGGYSRSTHNASSDKTSARMSGSSSAELTLDYVVYDFGRIRANEHEAYENLVAALHDLRVAELTVGYEVRSAYYTLLMDDALLEVARTNEWQYAEHLRQSEKQFKEGVVKKLDVTQARMNLSNAILSTISTSNDVVSASADLMRSLGLTTDHATRALVLPRQADPLDPLIRIRLARTDYDPAAALILARTNSPSLLVLRAKLRAASAAVDYAVADLFPELSLSSAFDFSDPSFPNTWNWSWGLKIVQSVFQGFRKTTAVDQAVVAMKSARADVAVAEQQLSLDLAKAVAARDTARQSFATAKIVIAQSKENLDLAIEQYRLGEISSIDLLDAESAYDSALGSYVKAAYGEQISEAKLGQLTGTWRPSEEDYHEKVD